MAGISFTLEKMTRQRALLSVISAYIYAAMLVAGPWIFTVIGIVGLSISRCQQDCVTLQTFRSIIIYNSLFSLIVISPLAFICGRFVSDELYVGRTKSTMYVLAAALVFFATATLVVVAPFYALTTTLTGAQTLAAIQNALLLGASWLFIPFLGAAKCGGTILVAFATGAVTMVLFGFKISDQSALGLLYSFNAALAIIIAIQYGVLVRRFGVRIEAAPGLLVSVKRYWELPVAGAAYALGLWSDKVIMWYGAPSGGLVVAGSIQTMPSYDTPMFWAQLASIPIIAVFFVHVETRFGVLFRRFYSRLGHKASLRELTAAKDNLQVFVISNVVGLFVALVIVAALMILITFVFKEALGLRPSHMAILRISLFTMAFHTSVMFSFIFLLYFDLRKPALMVVTTYFILNTTLTAALLPNGVAFYGYGSMFASSLTFMLAFGLLLRELPWLHYHAFITNNKLT